MAPVPSARSYGRTSLTRRQYTALAKAAETLCSAIDRIETDGLGQPRDCWRGCTCCPPRRCWRRSTRGTRTLAVASLVGHASERRRALHFVGYSADAPPGVTYGAALADLFYDSPVVKQFRRQYNLAKLGGTKPLAASLLTAYKQFGGKQKPRIGVMDFRPGVSDDGARRLPAAVRSTGTARPGRRRSSIPDQLEYKGDRAAAGGISQIDLILHASESTSFCCASTSRTRWCAPIATAPSVW